MLYFHLDIFTEVVDFPLFIQYGHHERIVEPHVHCDFSELVIVLSGHAVHHVGEESFYVKKGDVFVVNENTGHWYDEVKELRICNIMFRMRDLLTRRYDITHTAGFHALFIIEPQQVQSENFESRLVLSDREFLSLKNNLDFMLKEYEGDNEGRETMLISSFLYVVTALSRLYEKKPYTEKGNIMVLAETLSYIEKNFAEKITIEQMAEFSGYSKRHFNRLFKDTYKTTPLDYVLSLRIENACYLLKKKEKSISDIASDSGFDNTNYFCRIFKQRTGVTPSQYRQIF